MHQVSDITIPTSHLLLLRNESTDIKKPIGGLANSIIEKCGGRSNFSVVYDAVSNGESLIRFSGFESAEDVLSLFTTYKTYFMNALIRLSRIKEMTAVEYLLSISINNDISADCTEEAYTMLKCQHLPDMAEPRDIMNCYNFIHSMVIDLVTRIIIRTHDELAGETY